MASDAAEIVTGDSKRFLAVRFTSASAAQDALVLERSTRFSRTGVASSTAVDAFAVHYFRYSGPAGQGLGWLSDSWMFIAEAGDGPSLAALIASSSAGGMSATPLLLSPTVVAALFASAFAILLAIIYGLLHLFVRTIAVHPPAGLTALSRGELAARLVNLNAPDRPWLVRTGPEADLIVEWKYADAAWWGLLAKSGVKKSYRLRLFLDEARHRCGALDEFGELDWSAGLLAAPRVHFARTFFRGVQLVRMERGVAFGFQAPTASAGKVLDYSFDINDVKRPVVDMVTGCGWIYQPVIWPWRKNA